MSAQAFQLNLETVIAASPMLGHALEDRRQVRLGQCPDLLRRWQAASDLPLSNHDQRDLFVVAPLDVMVSQGQQGKQFHIIELNGTGIGGVTNLPEPVVAAMLDSLAEVAARLDDATPLVLVAVSGKESDRQPRLNKLMHERLLFVEALQRGLERRGGRSRFVVLSDAARDPGALRTRQPTVVLGYIKELVHWLRLRRHGEVTLLGRPVAAAVNDRFCLNVVDHFGGQVDLQRFRPINRSFLPGADKNAAYNLLDDFLRASPQPLLPQRVGHSAAPARAELIAEVLHRLRHGRPAVIKPRGTGTGHGIEFFLDPHERQDHIVRRIDRSIAQTEHYYAARGGAFPYTVCDFIDAAIIQRADHPLFGHKYELRVVVYRDGGMLRAAPSIVKISAHRFDPQAPDRKSLINNVTASAQSTQQSGADYVLPLARRQTLDLLGLTDEQMAQLCASATAYVRFVLDRLQAMPQRFGLPARSAEPAVAVQRRAA